MNFLNKEKSKIDKRPSFNIPPEVKKKFDKVFVSGRMNVLINISAGDESRYLEISKWINIINNISLINSPDINIIGLNSDSEKTGEIIKNLRRDNIKYIGTDNILEVAEIIRRNDIVITPDTSVIHICSVFNKPVVGLFPNVEWNTNKFKPLSDQNEIIISKDRESVKSISAEEVVGAFKKLIKKIESGNAESRTRVRKEDH